MNKRAGAIVAVMIVAGGATFQQGYALVAGGHPGPLAISLMIIGVAAPAAWLAFMVGSSTYPATHHLVLPVDVPTARTRVRQGLRELAGREQEPRERPNDEFSVVVDRALFALFGERVSVSIEPAGQGSSVAVRSELLVSNRGDGGKNQRNVDQVTAALSSR